MLVKHCSVVDSPTGANCELEAAVSLYPERGNFYASCLG
jgi:hypothetical protein